MSGGAAVKPSRWASSRFSFLATQASLSRAPILAHFAGTCQAPSGYRLGLARSPRLALEGATVALKCSTLSLLRQWIRAPPTLLEQRALDGRGTDPLPE